MRDLLDRAFRSQNNISILIAEQRAEGIGLRDTRAAEIFLRENIGCDLRPMLGNLDVLHRKNGLAIGISEHARALRVLELVEGANARMGEPACNLHNRLITLVSVVLSMLTPILARNEALLIRMIDPRITRTTELPRAPKKLGEDCPDSLLHGRSIPSITDLSYFSRSALGFTAGEPSGLDKRVLLGIVSGICGAAVGVFAGAKNLELRASGSNIPRNFILNLFAPGLEFLRYSLLVSCALNLLNYLRNCSPKAPIFSHILSREFSRLSTGFMNLFVSCWDDEDLTPLEIRN
jgi:hypothetical protein